MAGSDGFASLKRAACPKRYPKWRDRTGLRIGGLPFARNMFLYGGLRRVCKRFARRALANPSQAATSFRKPALSRHRSLQNRHGLPFRSGKLMLGTFSFCKPVAACHFGQEKRDAPRKTVIGHRLWSPEVLQCRANSTYESRIIFIIIRDDDYRPEAASRLNSSSVKSIKMRKASLKKREGIRNGTRAKEMLDSSQPHPVG